MKVFGLLLLSTISLTAAAQDFPDVLPEVVPAKISTAYIPQGFDNNDKSQIVVEGTFSSTCYKVGPYQIKADPFTNTVTVLQLAYKYKGLCALIPVKFTNVIDLGMLTPSRWEVRDASDNGPLGKMPVKPSQTVQADDYLYAPVSEMTIDVRGRTVTISGQFSNDCMLLKDFQVIRESHNVVIALPISEISRRPVCTDGDFPFRKMMNLPFLTDGRYLLHVRALNGQALNKIFQIGGDDNR
jgi:hypothetical protein